MASSPQRLDPDPQKRKPIIYEFERRPERKPIDRRSVARTGFGWWWAFWFVLIGLAVWWAGWGWGDTGGWWWGAQARTTSTYGPPGALRGAPATDIGPGGATAAITGSGLNILNAHDKRPFIGKPFHAMNVPVQTKVDNHVLWIGASDTAPMLLVLAGNGITTAGTAISRGNLVNVTGTIQEAPSVTAAKHQWSLKSGDTTRLEREGAYIQATQLTSARP